MENTLTIIEPGNYFKTAEPPVHNAFITANTVACTIEELRNVHHIPVFIKDNEPVISQLDFINTTQDVLESIFPGERILKPQIRVSHPIKGRVPEAKNKPANALQDWEKTIYYERAAFVFEIPSIQDEINGNKVSLTVGGVKAYNLDNLYSRKGVEEHFKIFIGFQNRVCTNMCVWSDGYIGDLKVRSIDQLKSAIDMLIQSYSLSEHLSDMKQLTNYHLTEQQFALLIGRCRMYQHLPKNTRENISVMSLSLTDTQVGAVVKDFYWDDNFHGNNDHNISLWNLYNLLTGANKTTYIDNFLDRSVNAYSFVKQLQFGIDRKSHNWFLS
jgi:hypothetical protein